MNNNYKIKKISNKKDYLLIEFYDLDNKIKVSLDTYIKYSLKKDTEIEEKVFNEILSSEEYLIAYNSCLRKLNTKDYATKEIKEYLTKNYKLSLNYINEIINKLTNYNYLNDEQFIKNKCELYLNSNYSYRQILKKLDKYGFENELIDKYLNIDDKLETKKAINIINKSLKSLSKYPKKSILQKLQLKLSSSGFDYNVINDAINSIDIDAYIIKEDELIESDVNKYLLKYKNKYDKYELKNKLYQKLLSKGYGSSVINNALGKLEDL